MNCSLQIASFQLRRLLNAVRASFWSLKSLGLINATVIIPPTQKLNTFLQSWVNLLSLDDEDAKIAGELRAEMDAIGRPIGQYDLLIAGQALRHNMTLVTAYVREFERVKTLLWEDWSKP